MKTPVKYIEKINLKITDCPVCNNRGKYEKLEYEIICRECGAVIQTPYPYVAGKCLNKNIDFKIIKKKKENRE